MSSRFFVAAVALAFISLAIPVAAQDQSAVEKVIKHCVDVVHKSPVKDTFTRREDFENFDAYYNPATGAVQNNARLGKDQAPLFQFEKCMASNGLPLVSLGPKK